MKYNGVLRILILQKHNIICLYYIENRAIFGQKNAIVKETERVKAWARSSKLLRLTGVFSQTADVLRSSCETEAGVSRPDMRSNSESMVARGQSLSVSGSPESEPPLYVMN